MFHKLKNMFATIILKILNLHQYLNRIYQKHGHNGTKINA